MFIIKYFSESFDYNINIEPGYLIENLFLKYVLFKNYRFPLISMAWPSGSFTINAFRGFPFPFFKFTTPLDTKE
jgi:hypothetical protein